MTMFEKVTNELVNAISNRQKMLRGDGTSLFEAHHTAKHEVLSKALEAINAKDTEVSIEVLRAVAMLNLKETYRG